ncbi:unnamed protein product [marine sediment metagenome]|uniref:Uncharacterized protein n=1 Tax=marine sediment metagenome TaxID=412755 RepID=X1QNJ8_9ZZZZ
MTTEEREPTREEVRRFMEQRKAGRADSKPFAGKWTGNYGPLRGRHNKSSATQNR